MKNKIIIYATPVSKSSFLSKNASARRYTAIWGIPNGNDNLSASETEDLPLYKFKRCEQQKRIYYVEFLRDRKNKAMEKSLFGYQRNPWLAGITAADMTKNITAAFKRLKLASGYTTEDFRKACAAMNKLKNHDN